MRLKTITSLRSLRGKRALLRVDFNIPQTTDGQVKVEGDERIRRSLTTIRYLTGRGGVVVVASHLGRPKGGVDPALSLAPVAHYVSDLLQQPVEMLGSARADPGAGPLHTAKPGSVWMLENLRFDPGEEANDASYAQALARWGGLYVNDAFGNCHRSHASMVGLPRLLPSYAGLLVAEEVRVLSALLQKPRRPLVAVIGGVKLSSKLAVIERFLKLADHVLLGGNLANTVLAAAGVAVGRSPVEAVLLPSLRQLDLTAVKLHLPVDVVAATATDGSAPPQTKAVANVSADEYILDVGPDTAALFDSVLREAATVVWSGPMGKFELPQFAAATTAVVHALAHTRARVVIGGGETVEACRRNLPKPAEEYQHLYFSTGGGAMLQFLERGTLPALELLRRD